jgi:hypothetical protein
METPTTPPRENERVRNISHSSDATPPALHHPRPIDRSTPLSKHKDVNNYYQDTFEEATDTTPKAIRTRSLTDRRPSISTKKHDATGTIDEAGEKENVLPVTNDGADNKSDSHKVEAVDVLDEVNLGDGENHAIVALNEHVC